MLTGCLWDWLVDCCGFDLFDLLFICDLCYSLLTFVVCFVRFVVLLYVLLLCLVWCLRGFV